MGFRNWARRERALCYGSHPPASVGYLMNCIVMRRTNGGKGGGVAFVEWTALLTLPTSTTIPRHGLAQLRGLDTYISGSVPCSCLGFLSHLLLHICRPGPFAEYVLLRLQALSNGSSIFHTTSCMMVQVSDTYHIGDFRSPEYYEAYEFLLPHVRPGHGAGKLLLRLAQGPWPCASRDSHESFFNSKITLTSTVSFRSPDLHFNSLHPYP
jgi:hypothetical protein